MERGETMLVTSGEIFEKFPGILEFFEQPKRKYQIQEEFSLSRGEAELVTDILLREGYIENTSQGWKRRGGK